MEKLMLLVDGTDQELRLFEDRLSDVSIDISMEGVVLYAA